EKRSCLRSQRALRLDEKRIGPPLLANRRRRAMARIDDRIVSKPEQHRLDRGDEGRMVAAGQIRAANRSGEQRIADEQVLAGLAFPSNLQADAAGAMA